MKLIYRLFLGFFSVVLLTAFVGLTGMDSTHKLGRSIQDIETKHLPSAMLLVNAATASHRACVNALRYSLRGNETNRVQALEDLGIIRNGLESYRQIASASQQWEILKTREEILQNGAVSFDKALRSFLALTGSYYLERLQSGEETDSGRLPKALLIKEEELHSAKQELLNSLNSLIDFEQKRLGKNTRSAIQVADKTRVVIFGIAIGALLLAVFQGVMVSRSISNPLDKLVKAAIEIGKGKLSTPIETEGDDEIQRLGKALVQMAENMEKSRNQLIDIKELEKAREALQKSENLLQTLINTTQDAMIAIDQTGRVTLFNPAGEKMFQRTREEMIGQTLDCLMPSEFRKNHVHYLKAFFSTGKPDAAMDKLLELPAIRGDGSTFPMEISLSSGQADSKTFVVGIARDISERKKTEENIVRAKKEWERTFDAVPDLIAIIDHDHRILRVNSAMAATFATTPAKMVGELCHSVVHGLEHPPDFCPHMCSLSDGSFHEVEIFDEGLEAFLHVTTSPMKDSEGNIVASVHIMRNITDRKHAEAELEKTHAKLIETARQIGMAEVATGVLHNVGNVLNSVNVSTEMIQRHVKESRVNDLVEVMQLVKKHENTLSHFLFQDCQGREILPFLQDLSRHLSDERSALLKEIQELSGYTSHISEIVKTQQKWSKIPGLMEPLKLLDVLEEVLMINAADLERKGVQVVRDFQTVPDVAADRHRLTQILMNLVSNAGHALQDNPAENRVLTIGLFSQPPGFVSVRVSDNGMGIPEQNMSRLFRYGFTTKEKGHGFGLHSCALAAQEMGGSLSSESEGAGKGSSFTMKIPSNNGGKEDA
ncbi:MAG: PAS domain S-box protein [Desulfatibacillum sp.]|nr:PAS domain S-box protein [Desulfatibacillum sp.]